MPIDDDECRVITVHTFIWDIHTQDKNKLILGFGFLDRIELNLDLNHLFSIFWSDNKLIILNILFNLYEHTTSTDTYIQILNSIPKKKNIYATVTNDTINGTIAIIRVDVNVIVSSKLWSRRKLNACVFEI